VTKPTARLVFDVRGPMLEAVRACEAEVFHKWYGNTREQLEQEYGPFDSSSAFLALVDERSEVLGTCRVATATTPGRRTVASSARPSSTRTVLSRHELGIGQQRPSSSPFHLSTGRLRS
jgi:hypothetical protein